MTDAALLALIKATPALRTFADAGNDYDIAAALPGLATLTIPKPFTAAEMMGCISAANRAKVALSAMYYGIQVAIDSQNAAAVANEAQLCVDAGLISPTEQTAVNAVLAATQKIPDTSVDHLQVSRVLNALRPVVTTTSESGEKSSSIKALPVIWN